MTDDFLPPAQVTKVPLRHRRELRDYWRRLLLIAAVLGGSWFTCRWLDRDRSRYDPLSEARKQNTARAYVEYAKDDKARDRVRPDLAKLHAAARTHLREAKAPHPEGLDPILAALLSRVEYRVSLVSREHTVDKSSFDGIAPLLARPGAEVAPIEGLLDSDYACAEGLGRAFAAATASDVIEFDTAKTSPVTLSLRLRARASGAAYVQPSSKRVFPGIAIAGSIELAIGDARLLEMPFDVTPARDVDFTTDMLAGLVSSGRDADIARGLLEAACMQLGVRIANRLTGWQPPAVPAPDLDDNVDTCEHHDDGAACYQAGLALRDGVGRSPDRERAIELFQNGCSSGALDAGACCVAAADLLLASMPKEDGPLMQTRARVTVMLDRGCHEYSAEACARSGQVRLMPYPGETSPTAGSIGEAAPRLVRACDLGLDAACSEVAKLLASPALGPSFTSAAALARRGCAKAKTCPDADRYAKQAANDEVLFGIALGKDRVFDVRWGDWFDLDQGRVVAWVASTSDLDTVRARLGGAVGTGTARVYPHDAVPYGVVPPPTAKTVWAVILGQPSFKDDEQCRECTSGKAPDPLLATGCECLPLDTIGRTPK